MCTDSAIYFVLRCSEGFIPLSKTVFPDVCVSFIMGDAFSDKGLGSAFQLPYLRRRIHELLSRGAPCGSHNEQPSKKEISAAVNLLIFCVIMFSVFLFGLEAIPVNLNWIVSCLCANMIFIAVYGRFIVKALAFPPLQAIGKCSFSIYLWHIPVVRTYVMIEKKFLPFYMDSSWNFILYFLVLIAVSALPYRYFERKSGFRKK